MSPDHATWTVPQLAERWQVSPDKIHRWIAGGQLRAFNAATLPTGRPRWRIALADVLTFEQARSAQAKPAAPRRRKAAGAVIEFF